MDLWTYIDVVAAVDPERIGMKTRLSLGIHIWYKLQLKLIRRNIVVNIISIFQMLTFIPFLFIL